MCVDARALAAGSDKASETPFVSSWQGLRTNHAMRPCQQYREDLRTWVCVTVSAVWMRKDGRPGSPSSLVRGRDDVLSCG